MEKEEQSVSQQETELVKPVELPNADSRLEKHLQKSAKKTILLTLGGFILFGIFLFFFGVPLLVGFSNMIGNNKNDTPQILYEETYIAPPTLDAPFETTKEPQITITGNTAGENLTIKLYLNNNLVDSTTAKKDGSFTFQNIKLEKGGNSIKAKTVNKKTVESAFSEALIITYQDSAPEIELTSPHDGETIKKDASPITVIGKTDPSNKITINNFWAIVDANGAFSYRLPLTDGENKITVIATDDAGNETKKELTVKVEEQ